MVRIGLAGIGFMGMIHYRAAQHLNSGRVVALCSRDPAKRAGDWRGIRGNFGLPGEVMDLSAVHVCEHIDQLLARPDIDLVDICLPTDGHAVAAIAALRAGKHVLVEKPIALRIEDADAMLAAARETGRLLMVAHVLPFIPEFAFALQAVRGGTYGRLLAAHFLRVISRPDWSAAVGDTDRTGGPALDLHVHDTHFISLLCGMPPRVFSTGTQENGAIVHLTTHYLHGPGEPVVTATSGALCPKGRPFVHGFEIYLEKAALIFESGTRPLTVLLESGAVEQPALLDGDPVRAFTAEIQMAVDAVAQGREADLLSGQRARDALVLCHRECESVRRGTVVALS